MTGTVKVAMIRTDLPKGQPGYLVLGCPCGQRPATELDGPDVICACGTVYAYNGYRLNELASWQDEPNVP